MGVTGPWRSGGTKETWSIKEGYGCKWPSSAVTVHGMGVNDGKVSPCSAQNHSHKKGITGGLGTRQIIMEVLHLNFHRS